MLAREIIEKIREAMGPRNDPNHMARSPRGPHFAPTGFYNPGTGHGAALQSMREMRRSHWQAFFHKDAAVPVIASRQVQRAGARALAKDLRSC